MSDTEVKDLRKEFAKESATKYWLAIVFTLITILVQVTLYLADKPNRDEVRIMINEKVDARINGIEDKLNSIEAFLRGAK